MIIKWIIIYLSLCILWVLFIITHYLQFYQDFLHTTTKWWKKWKDSKSFIVIDYLHQAVSVLCKFSYCTGMNWNQMCLEYIEIQRNLCAVPREMVGRNAKLIWFVVTGLKHTKLQERSLKYPSVYFFSFCCLITF